MVPATLLFGNNRGQVDVNLKRRKALYHPLEFILCRQYMKKNKKNNINPRVGRKVPKASNLKSDVMLLFRENHAKNYNYKQVASRLGIEDGESRKALLVVLKQLVGVEMLTEPGTGKFQLHQSQVAALIGTIDFTRSGAGYVSVENIKDDIYISEGSTGSALHGDTVEIVIVGAFRGTPKGKVLNVVERAASEFVGIIDIKGDHVFCIMSNSRIHVDFFIGQKNLKGAVHGDKVIVRLVEWPNPDKAPFGEVVSVLGKPGINEVEMHAILVEFGLPYEFPAEVVRAAEAIPIEISDQEISRRRDFRGITTFTIDPEDAKDFDDALSFHDKGNGKYEVGIHIADVSHYVAPNSVIDKEALRRATSVYLVDRVVPMLPEVLSNYVCSLRPHEDKLCVSAVFEMDENGKVGTEWFGKTVINSQHRFTYEDAQAIIEGKDGPFHIEVRQLNTWARTLRAERIKKGALEFSGSEVKFKLDANGKPIAVYQKVMRESNQLIEEFMLLANRQIARFLSKSPKSGEKRVSIYRIHDLPDQEKLNTLRDFVSRMDYRVKPIKPESASQSLNALMQQAKGKPEEDVIKQLAIRSMAKAVYSTDNIGHFGLAFEYYTHFTSPIRRYPDVMVHRLLEKLESGKVPESVNEMERQCKHSSNMEKRAADAERTSIKYKQVEFMLDKVGQKFNGTISGLTRWGMYVEIADIKIEGLVPINSMTNDTYRYDEKTNRVMGSRYKEIFEFGTSVEIQVESADLAQRQLEFRII